VIPFPSLIARILIGVVNDSWIARLVAPFIWPIGFCVHTSIVRSTRNGIQT